MTELNEHQTEILAQYQSLTGEEDTAKSVRILRDVNWDLETAVNYSIDDRAVGRPSHSQLQNQHHSQGIRTTRGSWGPMTLLSWPFFFAFRILKIPTSIVWGILRFSARFVGSFMPAGQREVNPTQETTKFVQQFESKYGNVHPNFFTGTYAQAVERARNECKFLLVYLHCELNQNTANFCRNTLCSETVTDFIDDNYIAWGSDIKYPQGYRVNDQLGATTYPFICILCCTPTNNSPSNTVTIVEKIEGMTNPSTLVGKLATVLENFGVLITNYRMERNQIESDRRIREEQDAAYLQSLAADQEKERKRQEEEERERREQEMAEAEERARQDLAKARQRTRDLKRQLLPYEPSDDDKDSVRLAIRLADGSKVSRRFKSTDTIQTVMDYVDASQEAPIENFILMSTFPKQVYSEINQTLKEAKLYPHPVQIIVSEK